MRVNCVLRVNCVMRVMHVLRVMRVGLELGLGRGLGPFKCPSGVPRADFVSLDIPQNFEVFLGVPQFFRSVPHSEGHIGFHSVPRLFSVSLKTSECPLHVLQISQVSVITRDTPDLLFLKR